jgi:hypothetical protein
MAPEGSRKLKFPDVLTKAQDGGNFVSLKHRPILPPGNKSGTHFCLRLSRPRDLSAIRRIYINDKFHFSIWYRTSDLLICLYRTLTTVLPQSPHLTYKIKHSHYRPGVAQRVACSKVSQIN